MKTRKNWQYFIDLKNKNLIPKQYYDEFLSAIDEAFSEVFKTNRPSLRAIFYFYNDQNCDYFFKTLKELQYSLEHDKGIKASYSQIKEWFNDTSNDKITIRKYTVLEYLEELEDTYFNY